MLAAGAFDAWGSALIGGVITGLVAAGVAVYSVQSTMRADRDIRLREAVLRLGLVCNQAQNELSRIADQFAVSDTDEAPAANSLGGRMEERWSDAMAAVRTLTARPLLPGRGDELVLDQVSWALFRLAIEETDDELFEEAREACQAAAEAITEAWSLDTGRRRFPRLPFKLVRNRS